MSHDSPMTLSGSHNRIGLRNWASLAPPFAKQGCRLELRIEGALYGKSGGMEAVRGLSAAGPVLARERPYAAWAML